MNPPDGLRYEPAFLSADEERDLLAGIEALPLTEARYKQYTARRRTMSFGFSYDYVHSRIVMAPAMPEFLWPLRARVAKWMAMKEGDLKQALVTEYRERTPLGWHRDAPAYERIVGVSLGGFARMRFRPYPPPPPPLARKSVLVLDVEPGSAYAMQDAARWDWQHSVAPTPGLRYSITFRSLLRRGSDEGKAPTLLGDEETTE